MKTPPPPRPDASAPTVEPPQEPTDVARPEADESPELLDWDIRVQVRPPKPTRFVRLRFVQAGKRQPRLTRDEL